MNHGRDVDQITSKIKYSRTFNSIALHFQASLSSPNYGELTQISSPTNIYGTVATDLVKKTDLKKFYFRSFRAQKKV